MKKIKLFVSTFVVLLLFAFLFNLDCVCASANDVYETGLVNQCEDPRLGGVKLITEAVCDESGVSMELKYDMTSEKTEIADFGISFQHDPKNAKTQIQVASYEKDDAMTSFGNGFELEVKIKIKKVLNVDIDVVTNFINKQNESFKVTSSVTYTMDNRYSAGIYKLQYKEVTRHYYLCIKTSEGKVIWLDMGECLNEVIYMPPVKIG